MLAARSAMAKTNWPLRQREGTTAILHFRRVARMNLDFSIGSTESYAAITRLSNRVRETIEWEDQPSESYFQTRIDAARRANRVARKQAAKIDHVEVIVQIFSIDL